MLQQIIVSYGQSNPFKNKKGMTLLEVLIALAILGIITISFITFFTNTNLGITYSGKRINAIRETKGILDEINLILGKNITYSLIKQEVEDLLENEHKEEYEIFTEEDANIYEYDGYKFHCLILNQDLYLGQALTSINGVEDNIVEIKMINFYDNREKYIELSIYVLVSEDKYEK